MIIFLMFSVLYVMVADRFLMGSLQVPKIMYADILQDLKLLNTILDDINVAVATPENLCIIKRSIDLSFDFRIDKGRA